MSYPNSETAQPPTADLVAVVRAAWADALGHDNFRDDEDFFVVGGHSVLAARVMGVLRKSLGVRLSLRLFFDNATVAQLAAALTTHTARHKEG